MSTPLRPGQRAALSAEHREHRHIETEAIRVWVDVDPGIARFVEWLNEQPGVRTRACCEGWAPCGCGTCEAEPANVVVSWSDEATFTWLSRRFKLERIGEALGYVFPTFQDLNLEPVHALPSEAERERARELAERFTNVELWAWFAGYSVKEALTEGDAALIARALRAYASAPTDAEEHKTK
jgi:hypothetical protein